MGEQEDSNERSALGPSVEAAVVAFVSTAAELEATGRGMPPGSGTALASFLTTYVFKYLGPRARTRLALVAPELESKQVTEDAVHEAVKAALDALDPLVIPALGRLVALYENYRPVDPFFRGVVRILQESDAERFSNVGDVVDVLGRNATDSNASSSIVFGYDLLDGSHYGFRMHRDAHWDRASGPTELIGGIPHRSMVRLLASLETGELIDQFPTSDQIGGAGAPPVYMIDLEVLRKLGMILDRGA